MCTRASGESWAAILGESPLHRIFDDRHQHLAQHSPQSLSSSEELDLGEEGQDARARINATPGDGERRNTHHPCAARSILTCCSIVRSSVADMALGGSVAGCDTGSRKSLVPVPEEASDSTHAEYNAANLSGSGGSARGAPACRLLLQPQDLPRASPSHMLHPARSSSPLCRRLAASSRSVASTIAHCGVRAVKKQVCTASLSLRRSSC